MCSIQVVLSHLKRMKLAVLGSKTDACSRQSVNGKPEWAGLILYCCFSIHTFSLLFSRSLGLVLCFWMKVVEPYKFSFHGITGSGLIFFLICELGKEKKNKTLDYTLCVINSPPSPSRVHFPITHPRLFIFFFNNKSFTCFIAAVNSHSLLSLSFSLTHKFSKIIRQKLKK